LRDRPFRQRWRANRRSVQRLPQRDGQSTMIVVRHGPSARKLAKRRRKMAAMRTWSCLRPLSTFAAAFTVF